MPASGFGINRRLVRVIVPSGFGIATSGFSGITRIIVRDRGLRDAGVQLEVGAVAPPFEDRGLRDRGSGTIVRVRVLASGYTRLLPGSSPVASRVAGRKCASGELTRTIVHAPRVSSLGPAGKTTRTIVRYWTGGSASRLDKKIYLGG